MLANSTTTRNDNWIEALGIKRAKISVLIIGNNPIEMTSFYNVLTEIRSKNYLADVCFDVKDSFERISKNKPGVLLVDDNLPLDDIQKMVRVLRQNSKTKDIKIIVLKSSNWNYTVIDNVDDYILKDTVKADLIDRIIDKNLYPAEHHFA
jgi:PleD family two-component response regulator